jgi:hypothetical protein
VNFLGLGVSVICKFYNERTKLESFGSLHIFSEAFDMKKLIILLMLAKRGNSEILWKRPAYQMMSKAFSMSKKTATIDITEVTCSDMYDSRTYFHVSSSDLQLGFRLRAEQPSRIIFPSWTEGLSDVGFEGIWGPYLFWVWQIHLFPFRAPKMR